MALEFFAEPDPPGELCEEAAALDPGNPFRTAAYTAYRVLLGERAWLIGLRQDGRLVSACTAFMRTGRLSRFLELPSVPDGPEDSLFWTEFARFCRRQRVTDVELNSFAARAAALPPLTGETARVPRCEYVVDLQGAGLRERLSSNHQRNVKRARKQGVEVRRTREPEACGRHAELVGASMERRAARGETIEGQGTLRGFTAALESGAGELFQAVLEGQVVSSILVLRAARGAYYQSAGTSPEGMAAGASHFLISEVAEALRGDGLETFNLGGAEENPGLVRFKTGFGPCEVPLEAAVLSLESGLRRKVRTLLRLARHDPAGAARYLCRLEPYVVYAASPAEIAPTPFPDGFTIEKLAAGDLEQLAARYSELADQVECLRQAGAGGAYGVFRDGELAHVSWLVTDTLDQAGAQRNVKLRPGEAEITHCVTLPAFRGQGIYPLAIRHLCGIAAREGVRRVFMITNASNQASRRGIEKAGLSRGGRIVRVAVGPPGREVALTYRGHRLGPAARERAGDARDPERLPAGARAEP